MAGRITNSASPLQVRDLVRHCDDLEVARQDLERRNRELVQANAELEDVCRQYEVAVVRASELTLQAELLEYEIRQIFDAAVDPIWLVDSEFRVKRTSHAMCTLLKRRREAIVGQSCHELLPLPLCRSRECPLARFKSGAKRVECDVELPNGNDLPAPHILTASPFFGLEGELVGAVVSLKDITARKRDEAALKHANRELARLATVDGLTQIANRRAFDAHLEREWRRQLRDQTGPLSLIMGDIDFFKRYNDHYGHQQGDDCLRAVAGAIQTQVKRPADLAARYGGEEFAVILPQTPLEGAQHVADAIRNAVAELQIPHSRSEVAPHVTMSIGVACRVPEATGATAALLNEADAALYAAKSQGRDRVVVHSSSEADADRT
jgi:diguanylate cyclase (GGDEF)-like protein/PAS domain S-box-containing protein